MRFLLAKTAAVSALMLGTAAAQVGGAGVTTDASDRSLDDAGGVTRTRSTTRRLPVPGGRTDKPFAHPRQSPCNAGVMPPPGVC